MTDNVIESEDSVLPIDAIQFSHLRIRRNLNQIKLNQLAQSMEYIGQLQRIGVYKKGNGYEIIFGERRLRAAQILNWQTIQAKIFKVENDQMILSIIAAENLQDENFKTIENVEIVRRYKEFGFSNQAISQILFQQLNWVVDHEFVMRNPQARSIAEAGMLLDAASLRDFMKFPPSIRNMLMEMA